MPAHPIRGTLAQSWPGKNRSSRQFKFSSSKILIQACAKYFLLNDLQHLNHLLALHARKAIEEHLDGIACLQMVEKAFDRDSGSDENGRAAHDFRVRMHDARQTLQIHSRRSRLDYITCEAA